MTLRLYNTLTRTKEDFTPIDPNNVRMYVCGPTVYDFAHIGNARPVIVFDVLFRLLRHLYGAEHVKYVRNITDVDDKINARALRDFPNLPLNEAIARVTAKTADQFQSDAKALGCLEPSVQPRATKHIGDMVTMINKLLATENAYIAKGSEGREVLFEISKMSNYGILSGRILEEQQAGARVAVEGHKKNPADFVLWKESGESQPGWLHEFMPMPSHGYEGEFTVTEKQRRESGLNSTKVTIHGRPGWHIECSAMSMSTLLEPFGGGYDVEDKTKNTFDIHGGGLDLIFPHHENEIAQSCCALGVKRMANVWMHNGFLQVEGQKMSKSLGNFVTIADVLKDWPGDRGEIPRLNMLRTHYRQPIDWTRTAVQSSSDMLDDWYRIVSGNGSDTASNIDPDVQVVAALEDDLNTHAAIARLQQMRNELAHGLTGILQIEAKQKFAKSANLLGLLTRKSIDWFREREKGIDKSKVVSLIEDRLVARHTKNWKESDRIRDELDAMGVAIKDNKDGTTTWEVKR